MEKCKKMLVMLVMAVLAANLQAGIVNIDFTRNTAGGPVGNNMQGVLGTAADTTWNPYSEAEIGTVKSGMVDSVGAETGMTFSTILPPEATNGGIQEGGLMTGFFWSYLYLTGNGAYDVEGNFVFGNLVAGEAYDIALYATWNWIDAGSNFTIDGVTKGTTGTPSEAAAPLAEGASYVLFENVIADAGGQISGTWRANPNTAIRGPFNAVQIEGNFVPEPATLVLLSVGAVLGIKRRRQ